jgi:hypothetical protein
MANPTSNFNWQMPTASDLVTDLPADFEVFGQAVDTSLADLKGGTTDQVLAKNSNTDMDFKWVTSDDANAIQNSIVDAKGDLIAASANDTPARLAVGNNGETLVADSSTSTGLRYNANFAAGKNAIINGDFTINQRAFTSITTDGTYGFDRWALGTAGGATYTPQTFTAGAAPVAGYEAINFAQIATTGQTATSTVTILLQRIEDVRTFAGQTATVSFWAKATSGTPKIAVEMQQNFGSGGSATVNTYAGQITMTTSWARYSVTIAVPSVSGKTIGTSSFTGLQLWTSAGSDFNARTGSLGIQTATIGIWGVQVEDGSVATAFQTATGTIQGELAACQRYYFRTVSTNAYGRLAQFGNAVSSTVFINWVQPPVPMRITPTAIEYSANLGAGDNNAMVAALTSLVLDGQSNNSYIGFYAGVASGLTTYRPYNIIANGSTTSYIAATAEL